MSCSSAFIYSSPASSSLNASSSLSGAAMSTSSMSRSPYVNLESPEHITSPPRVTSFGLTFPKVNTSLASLSSVVPTSALPSLKSKSRKLKGKFWASGLDEGQDFNIDDILPVGSNVKSKRRYSRNNPGPVLILSSFKRNSAEWSYVFCN